MWHPRAAWAFAACVVCACAAPAAAKRWANQPLTPTCDQALDTILGQFYADNKTATAACDADCVKQCSEVLHFTFTLMSTTRCYTEDRLRQCLLVSTPLPWHCPSPSAARPPFFPIRSTLVAADPPVATAVTCTEANELARARSRRTRGPAGCETARLSTAPLSCAAMPTCAACALPEPLCSLAPWPSCLLCQVQPLAAGRPGRRLTG